MQNYVRIAGTGSYLPEKILTNFDLEKMVETSDEWIRTRTGIAQRHIAAKDEATSDMGAVAATNALEMAGMTPEDIDLIIVATITPDVPFPNTGCYIQKKIGAKNATAFSVEAACSGFVFASDVAVSMLDGKRYKRALVVGAEKMSSIVDWEDRSTCVLFGDAAGAMILEAVENEEENSYIGAQLGTDGNFSDILYVPGGGSRMPLDEIALNEKLNCLRMSGQEVFKQAVNTMSRVSVDLLGQTGIDFDQVRWLVPHQANIRIINAIRKKLRLPEERCYVNVDRIGNSSAATIPVAIDEIVRNGDIQKGDLLLTVAFGGGLTWGSSILRWTKD
ncbi:MAG: ketoacyl-ACP synthase III [Lentisphaeria bacterium]|nr:ketoacyl-ACP synthase III [Lentisphaeria bacterium]